MGLAAFNRMRRENAAKKIPVKEKPDKPATKALEDLSYNELKAMAKNKGIEGYGSMKKVDLLEALQGKEGD